ncbi:MAG: heavy metal translocating P-type ATPase, partial [Phycisphaerae bacterium]|nr:heavy metal translocating P-type ATPase [Phycisphaerae bacterium]
MMLAPLRATLPPPPPTGDTSLAAPACAHCGLPVPPALRRAASTGPAFCCSGCETAYSIIHACGLDRFYDLRKQAESAPAPAPTTPRDRRYAEFDEPAFLQRYARSLPAGLTSVDLLLENVHCAACVWLVERLPALLPGVIECRLDFRRAVARVTWRPDAVPLARIALLLSRLGYPPHPARGEAAHRARTNEERRMIARLGVAAACASSTMLFALALYAGLFSGIDHATVTLFRWFSLAITLLCLLWPGLVFFRSAITSLRAGVANLDAPIALALLAGGLWSIASTLRGTGEVYFDSLSTLVFLLLMGRFVQRRQQRRAADSVELLFTLTASAARVVSDSGTREVSADALTPGDVVEVRAGESFPADGIVIHGRSAADLSLLTGESRPVEIREGSDAVAGAVNLGSTVLVSVRASGEATRAGRLMKLVEDAAHRRAPIVRTADKAASWFLAGMTLLAGLTFALWLRSGLEPALEHAIAVLVVTCPCALGLATPLAFSVAIGRAARAGAFIKGGDAIQRLASPGRIILDKTGTLTVGRLALARWTGDNDARPLVAAVEACSSHPVAVALVRDLANPAREPLAVTDA